MISFEPFWNTLRSKELSTYILINQYGISSSTINQLRHNQPISTVTLNDLCTILRCGVNDILLFIPDEVQD